MAPSSGHILLPKVIKAFKYALSRTAQALRDRLAQEGATAQALKIPIRNGSSHPLAALKRSHNQSRSFSTSIRKAFIETYPSLRSKPSGGYRLPASRTTTLIVRSPGASSFASTLRPNLTGGALPRSAGGYGNIGGKRMFSSIPGSQAQVLHNVSSGVRAFWLGGQRGQFDGIDKITGEKRFVAVGKKQATVARDLYEARNAGQSRGTTLEFCIEPTLAIFGQRKKHRTSLGLNDAIAPLASDFARSLGSLAAVHSDLKRLSILGDLSISESRSGWLAVRFPGCDGRTVESLCSELGICRGIIREDASWEGEVAQDVKMALLFPTAPSEEQESCVDAHFYPAQPSSDELIPEDLSYTVEATLSPLGSQQQLASSVHDYDHVSVPASTTSWHANPWLDEVRPAAQGLNSDQDLDSGQRNEGSNDPDSVCILKFLAECDDRLIR